MTPVQQLSTKPGSGAMEVPVVRYGMRRASFALVQPSTRLLVTTSRCLVGWKLSVPRGCLFPSINPTSMFLAFLHNSFYPPRLAKKRSELKRCHLSTSTHLTGVWCSGGGRIWSLWPYLLGLTGFSVLRPQPGPGPRRLLLLGVLGSVLSARNE